MKVVSTMTPTLILASCIVPTVLVAADQYQYQYQYAATSIPTQVTQVDDQYQVQADDQYQVQADDQYEVQADDQYQVQADDYNSNAYEGFTVCSDTAIQVTDVSIYCDSPGTFYYGSGKYRNSENCTAGDKGQYQVDFYINEGGEIEGTGGAPVMDVEATGYIGWYDKVQKVFENEDLCSSSALKSLSGSKCPAAGKYRIKSSFFWDEDANYDGVFNPKITVGFKSSIYENTYDYGGANTPYCSGTTFFTSWKNGVKKVYANSISNFFKTFGILAFTIAVMVSFIWLMVRKPTSFQDAGTKMGFRRVRKGVIELDDDSSYDNSDDFDFNKMKSPGAKQSFLDF